MTEAAIRFRKEMEFDYGVAHEVTPMVRRIVARNPSGFTFHGTNTFIVGHGKVAVIDPGPMLEEHVGALAAALKGETVQRIVVTHTHNDHSPGAAPLRDLVDGEIMGAIPKPIDPGARTQESIQYDFAPDTEIHDGDLIEGDGWTLEAVHTPGHMSNHMCFALEEENILFTGDHIMGWNTTVVSPPDGNMKEYFNSLEVCLARTETMFVPAHGPEIEDPIPFTRAYRSHRRIREGQIADCLDKGLRTVPEIVGRLYRHLPAKMHGAASRSIVAHLEHMVETNRAQCDGAVDETGVYFRS
jgi:glyoxylase-like metal-dependent hydrolase (beta-lactamase superfamily II)